MLWFVQCIFEHTETTDQSSGELVHIARQFGHVFFERMSDMSIYLKKR